MQIIKKLLIILLFLTTTLFASQSAVEDLAKLSANSLYNLDNEQVEISIEPYLEGKEYIKALKIIDNTDNSIFFSLYKKDGKFIKQQKIPQNFLDLKQYSSNIVVDNEIIGKIIIFIEHNLIVDLTKEELKWIDTHIVKIGVEQWLPVVFSNTGKDIDGIAGDFTKKIIEKTGLKVKIINNSWNTLLRDFEDKKLDILPATYFTKKRAEFGLYSQGYFKMKDSIYFKNNNKSIHSLEDLEGKTLAIPKGYGTTDKLKDKYPKIKLVFTKDLDDSINRVLNGRVDAFYEGQIAAKAKIDNELIKGLSSISVKAFKAPLLYFFSKMDEPILHSIIQKALKSISYQEKSKIISKWTNDEVKILLTNKEKRWLDKDKVVRFVFDPDWRPIEWADVLKEHKGIISDVIKLIEQKSGISITPIYANSWIEAIESVKLKKSDAFSAGETKNRKEYMNFTHKSLLITPFVFVSRKDDNYLNGFKDTENKKIAVLNEATIANLMSENMPQVNCIKYNSDEQELKDLEDGKVDIVLLNAITAKYYINSLGYSDLKIAYKTKFNLDLKFALRKDFDEEALTIINKSLDIISEKEMSDIVDKWTRDRVKSKTDWILLAKIGGAIFLIILLILWNNHKLNVMVKEKTASIEQQKNELEDLTENLEMKVNERTKDLEKAKKEVEAIHKHTRDSIEYASLIQNALIPKDGVLTPFFSDHFVTWIPKDTVGGDIWLFNELRHEDECLLFFIDCTGHGVPGAFVTMIVKSIEREIVAKIKEHKEFDVSPAIIMSYFNKTMKTLLRQETKDSLSNAGWDGGIIYYNRQKQILKFAGAETPLFYTEADGTFKTIKGNRYSVGYKKCDMNYEYKESVLEVKEGMKFFCTTDGYLDQNGGAKDFPFGKKRFSNIIRENYNESMKKLQRIFQTEIIKYELEVDDNDRNDDITVIGFEIGNR